MTSTRSVLIAMLPTAPGALRLRAWRADDAALRDADGDALLAAALSVLDARHIPPQAPDGH